MKSKVIIIVGSPGSKYVKDLRNSYFIVSEAYYGSVESCNKALLWALKEGKSVIVDTSNLIVDQRKYFLDEIGSFNVELECVALITEGLMYEIPTLEEGFDTVIFKRLGDSVSASRCSNF